MKRGALPDDPEFDTIDNAKVRKKVEQDEKTAGKSGNMYLSDGTKRRNPKPKALSKTKYKQGLEGAGEEGDATYLRRVGDASGYIATKLMEITTTGFTANDKTVRKLIRQLFEFYEKLIDTIPAGMDANRDINLGFWTADRDYKELKAGRQTDSARVRWFQQAANLFTQTYPRPRQEDLLSPQRLGWVRESPEFKYWFNEIVLTQNRLKELMPKYFGGHWQEGGKNFGKVPSTFDDMAEP